MLQLPFCRGGNGSLSQDGDNATLIYVDIYIYTLELEYAWWGSTRYGASAPPADPQLTVLHIPPYPPPELSFTVSWRGVGGQRRLW